MGSENKVRRWMRRLCLPLRPLFEKSDPAWGSLSLLWMQRVYYSIKSTGMYLGLEFPISCFYFSAFIWRKRCTLSCWSLGVDVEVSSSLYVFWTTIWHNNATLWYMIMAKLAKCIISAYLKTMFDIRNKFISVFNVGPLTSIQWRCGLYC